jgi:type II secretory pathway component PulC
MRVILINLLFIFIYINYLWAGTEYTSGKHTCRRHVCLRRDPFYFPKRHVSVINKKREELKIKVLGIVEGDQNKKSAVLEVKGKKITVCQGDKFMSYCVKKILDTSVILESGGKEKCISF